MTTTSARQADACFSVTRHVGQECNDMASALEDFSAQNPRRIMIQYDGCHRGLVLGAQWKE